MDEPIVVVGAGSTGCSTAYHLAKAGEQVVLVDRGQVASGTTSRSSAVVRTHYSNEIVARMALYSLGVFNDFASIGESGFVRTGMLMLAPPEHREAVMANVQMLNRVGARNDILDRAEASRMFPEITNDDADCIVVEPESGYADPSGVANSYARAAERYGARLLLGREVARLDAPNGVVESVVLSDATRLRCSRVVLCTNVWTNSLLARSGVKNPRESVPLWTVPHPMVAFARPTSFQGKRPVIWDGPGKTYYKPEGRSLIFVGTLDSVLDSTKLEPEDAPSDVPFETMESLTEAITKRIPVMGEGSLHSSYVCMYDVTPDQHPILDELSELGLGGAFCCVGLNGHGFKLCPALGLMTAEMVLGRTGVFGPSFDRSYFALSRFKNGREMKTKYSGLATVA